MARKHPAHRAPGRHTHWRLAKRRRALLGAGGMAALLAVVGPGLLAGLSDDDPAGIATYSILGAKYGYELIPACRWRRSPSRLSSCARASTASSTFCWR